MIQVVNKPGKELSLAELEVINAGRLKEFGSEDKLEPQPGNVNWEAIFFLLKDEGGRILAFGKLHQMKVVFAGVTYSVYCLSTLISLDKDKGYGRQILKAVETFLATQVKTTFGFCETGMLPFYLKSGLEVLSRADNQFYFIEKNCKSITDPNIIPGEVIVIRGKDGLTEKVLASVDKGVGVID